MGTSAQHHHIDSINKRISQKRKRLSMFLDFLLYTRCSAKRLKLQELPRTPSTSTKVKPSKTYTQSQQPDANRTQTLIPKDNPCCLSFEPMIFTLAISRSPVSIPSFPSSIPFHFRRHSSSNPTQTSAMKVSQIPVSTSAEPGLLLGNLAGLGS